MRKIHSLLDEWGGTAKQMSETFNQQQAHIEDLEQQVSGERRGLEHGLRGEEKQQL